MLITPFIAKTVRTLERKKAKMESELGIVNDVLGPLKARIAVPNARMAAHTRTKIGKGVRAAWKAKRKA